MSGIRAKQRFYLWAVKKGIDLKNFEPERIEIHQVQPKRKSTFKQRANEVKQRFNHVFKMPSEPFGRYPNIEKISFVPAE